MEYPSTIKEAQARQRKVALYLVYCLFRIIIGTIIGGEWLINWNNFIDSWIFRDNVESYLQQYFSQVISHYLALIIQNVSPWFCIICLFQPLHYYLKYIGWYCHSDNSDSKGKTATCKPL